MMIAWYLATALAKQWEETIPYLEERRLSEWVHRKTIQKAVESYRITKEKKGILAQSALAVGIQGIENEKRQYILSGKV